MSVLDGVDWDKISIDIIGIEMSGGDVYHKRLVQLGYVCILSDLGSSDSIYVHQSADHVWQLLNKFQPGKPDYERVVGYCELQFSLKRKLAVCKALRKLLPK